MDYTNASQVYSQSLIGLGANNSSIFFSQTGGGGSYGGSGMNPGDMPRNNDPILLDPLNISRTKEYS